MSGGSVRFFQIKEPDLSKLEAGLPLLQDFLGLACNEPKVQVVLEEVKEILSNVRWNYGPYQEVRHIPANGGPGDEHG